LVDAGHEVNMVTTWREPTNKKNWFITKEAGIQVHWLPVPYSNQMSYSDRIRSFIKFAWSSAWKAASLPGDVVFATSTPLTIALPAIYAKYRQNIPMVFEVRDLWPELPIAVGALRNPLLCAAARALEKLAYRKSAHVVALSPGMKDGIVRAGYPQNKVSVIPNSCDLDLFSVPKQYGADFRLKYEWLGDRPLVVYTGTFGIINGVSYLVHLAEAVRNLAPEVCFLSIGDGYEYSMVADLAKKKGILNDNFYIMQAIPKKEVPSLLSAATMTSSLFIDLPEMWANSANKFFDGLAAGCPIAINYGGWQAELIKETGAGIVLPPKDITRAAQLLISAIRNKEWLDYASAAALKLARTRFDRNQLARQLESVLLSVVDGKMKCL
jgi:glycosyltransferase involved in cell wall biosynthesis